MKNVKVEFTNICTLPTLWPGKIIICFSPAAKGLNSKRPLGFLIVSSEKSLCVGAGNEKTCMLVNKATIILQKKSIWRVLLHLFVDFTCPFSSALPVLTTETLFLE